MDLCSVFGNRVHDGPQHVYMTLRRQNLCMLQGTIKEAWGQPWVNTFREVTRWRHGDVSEGNVVQLRVSAGTAARQLCVRSALQDEEMQNLWLKTPPLPA